MKPLLLAVAALSLVSGSQLTGGRLGSPEIHRHKKDPAKLKALYERYPQLTDPKVNACARKFGQMLMDLTYPPYDQM